MAFVPFYLAGSRNVSITRAPRCSLPSIPRREFLCRTAPAVLLFHMTAAGAQPSATVTDIKVGDGDAFKSGDLLKLHYTLTLGAFQEDGGKIIDSSRSRGRPFSYKYDTGSVIKGWDQGVSGMKVGGRRRLVIPPELGYGPQGAGNVIPPNSTLYFDIELLGIGYK